MKIIPLAYKQPNANFQICSIKIQGGKIGGYRKEKTGMTTKGGNFLIRN